jgi:hypothetical protein
MKGAASAWPHTGIARGAPAAAFDYQGLRATTFGLQLPPSRQTIRIKLAFRNRREHCASWFMVMTAVAELACRGKLRDLCKESV